MKYFLFTDLDGMYAYNVDGVNGLLTSETTLGYQVANTDNEDVEDMLELAASWGEYMAISEDDYNKLV